MSPPEPFAAIYMEFINGVRKGTGMADTLLHVHAGMVVLLAARLVTRRPLSSPVPLLVVIVVEVANEVLDRIHYGSWRWPDTTVDFVNTVFWPAVLFIGLRLRGARYARTEAVPSGQAQPCSPAVAAESTSTPF